MNILCLVSLEIYLLLFQEYFFKSQESLATVIDFVDEDLKTIEEGLSEDTSVDPSSTHSSPREPASRRKDIQLPERLTP